MSHSDRDRVATNLRLELARRQMSGADLARLTGWSKATTTRRLSGENDIPLSELTHAARSLEVSLAVLLEGVETEAEPTAPADGSAVRS